MKRRTLRIILWIAGPITLALAILGFSPGFAYQLGDPSKLQIEKRYRPHYHSLRIHSAFGHFKYEWAPGSTYGFCWGPEGFSTRPNQLYFREGAFELEAWL